MNHKLRAVVTELEKTLLAEISLRIEGDQYRFKIFCPDEGVTHFLIFDRTEFDHSSLAEIFDLLKSGELIEEIELAPFATKWQFDGGMGAGCTRRVAYKLMTNASVQWTSVTRSNRMIGL